MANSYTTYIGWVAKTNQDWLKFASGNTEGEHAGFVTLSKNRRILTVSDEGGGGVENFTILYDAEPNFSVNKRSATVTLTQNYNSTSGAIKTVEITQTGSKITGATFTVKDGNIIGAEDGITYNILYTIGVPKGHYADDPTPGDHTQPSDDGALDNPTPGDHTQPSDDGALDNPTPGDHTQPSDDGALDEPAPGDHIQSSDDDLLTAYNEVNGHSLDNIASLDDASTIYDDTIINNEAEGIEAIDPSVLPSDETSGQHSMDTQPSDEQLQPIWVTGHPSIDDEVIWADPGNAEIDDQNVNPNHGISENDDTDDEMNRKYNFDSGNVITPDAGAVRTKLTCEVNFIVEVIFSYSASTMTNKGLYWYCGERENERPVWYKAVYDERTSKYYKDDKLSYDNDDEYAILNAINSSISDENIYMSAATSQTVSSIISSCSWHKDSGQSYVTLTTSATYGYYEYTFNGYISPQTQDLADRPITIIRKRESVPGSSSSLRLNQPRNSFRSGYNATAWIGYGIPTPRQYVVSPCSGSTVIHYMITRTLVYPLTPIVHISKASGATFEYETNLSVNTKVYPRQNIHVSSVLGLTLDLTTINGISQEGIPEIDIEMTPLGYEYVITSIIYNGTSYEVGGCIPFVSGSLTVDVDVKGSYEYNVTEICPHDITFIRSSLTHVTITQEVSENTGTSSRNIDVPINGTAVINVMDGLVETQDFSIRGSICQEGRNLIFKLESNPENAEFNVGRLPLIDSNWDTRGCELTITHEE